MRFARVVSTLVLTAHGSADPRSAASAHELAHTIRTLRRDVDVRVAFCEQNFPNLQDVLAAIREDRAPVIDGPEGRRSVEIILAIYKAAETGRAVKLPLESDPVLKARKNKAKPSKSGR